MAKVYQRVPGDPSAPPITVEISDEQFQQQADLASKIYLDANPDVKNYITTELNRNRTPVTEENLYNEARVYFAEHNKNFDRPGTEAFKLNLTYAGIGAAPGGDDNPSPFKGETAETYVNKISDLGYRDGVIDMSPTTESAYPDPANRESQMSFITPEGGQSPVDPFLNQIRASGPIPQDFDFEKYLENNPSVREAINQGETFGINPFFFQANLPGRNRRREAAERHYQLFGKNEGLGPTGLPLTVSTPTPPPSTGLMGDPDPVQTTQPTTPTGPTPTTGTPSTNVTPMPTFPTPTGPTPTTTTTPSPDFSKFLNQEGTGIRQDLQVDFSNFEKDYLAANPDVAQAVGTTPGAGLQHYFDYGKAEGRPGASPALQGLSQLDYQALTANPNDPNLSPEVKDRMLKGLQARDVGRATGFKGIFTGVEGGEAYDRFKKAVGSRKEFVDPYGRQTALGREEEQRDRPTLIKGEFNEQEYLRQNPDVAEAVRAGTIPSGKAHFEAFGKLEGRDEPTKGGTELQLQRLKTRPDEFLDASTYQVDPTRFDVTTARANIAQARDPVKTGEAEFTAQERFNLVAQQDMTAAKQEDLSDTIAAQKGTVSTDATVQGQLAKLMTQFEDGKIPAFAAGAVRTAEQRLAARGMGASSMAGAAIVQAAMEASTPIAAADAETYRRMQELNLNNRQQAEVLNSQMALQLDLANLNNEQQAKVTNSTNRVQSLFTDQSAVNTARQFNATNDQQNDQFFASLFNDVAKFNTAQTNGLRQFNAGQENAIEQFNSTMANNRDQFNVKNSIVIDQANAVYRRQVNTSNTAIANAEAEYNTRNLFNISQNAQNRLLQEQRDQINFARVNAINETAFQNNLALSSYAFDRDLELAGDISKGNFIGSVLAGVADKVISKI